MLDASFRPKVDEYEGAVLVSLKTLTVDPESNGIAVEQVSLLVRDDLVVVVNGYVKILRNLGQEHMPGLESEASFPIFLSAMVVIAVGMLVLFRRRH